MKKNIKKNSDVKMVVWGPRNPSDVGSVVLKSKTGTDFTIDNTFKIKNGFSEFVLPLQFATSEHLPATVSLRINGVEVDSIDLTLNDNTTEPEYPMPDEQVTQMSDSMDNVKTAVQSLDALLTSGNVFLSELNNKTPDIRTDFMAGRIRSGGGKIALTSTQTGAFQLKNPAESGKVFTISSFYLACDMSVDVTFSFDSTLTGTTSNVVPFSPNRAVSSPTSAVCKTAVGAPTGGTALSPVYRVAANTPVIQDFTVILLPGQSVEARIGIGALTSATFYVSATWAEDPA